MIFEYKNRLQNDDVLGFKSNSRSSRVLMASMAALKGYNMVTYAPLEKKHPTLPWFNCFQTLQTLR
ncbi:hypothetical protein Hanom_Chr01g00025141 [Helianthus anomalus]